MKHLDFIVLDIFVLQIAFNIAYMVRHGRHWMYFSEAYTRLSVVLIFISICVGFFIEGYSGILRRGYLLELKETIKYVSLVSGILIISLFVIKESEIYSRSTVIFLWGIGIVLNYIARIILKSWLQRKSKEGEMPRAVLVITTEEQAKESIEQIRRYAYSGISPVAIAIAGEYSGKEKIAELPVIGKEEDVIPYIKANVVDEIYINTSREMKLENEVEKYIEAGITVHMKLLSMEKAAGYKCVENFAGATVLTTTFKSATARQLFMKRILDICGGIVGVILTGIVFIFVAPIIHHQSPGPIFFSQWRVGRNGRKFKIYKFRSMYMDAEERKKELMEHNQMDGFMFKMDNDPRIFPFGHFLRNSSLDEFPQFLNVLKGDMSLVGTRPPTVDEYEQYDLHHIRRVSIKPGLTGLWQVSGRSDITDFEEVVRLDTEYISDWRLSYDLKILFRTVGVVLMRKGSK